QEWSDKLGIPFHEARMGSNGHNLTLIFSDLRVDQVPVGYSPFTISRA
ncbi:YxiG-like protein, partial [Leifsonia shinshuensis]